MIKETSLPNFPNSQDSKDIAVPFILQTWKFTCRENDLKVVCSTIPGNFPWGRVESLQIINEIKEYRVFLCQKKPEEKKEAELKVIFYFWICTLYNKNNEDILFRSTNLQFEFPPKKIKRNLRHYSQNFFHKIIKIFVTLGLKMSSLYD